MIQFLRPRVFEALLIVACSGSFTCLGAQQAAAPPVSPQQRVQSDPALQRHNPRYVIQDQDVLKLSFELLPDLNQTTTVQPDGYINLKGAPSVHVQGLTVPEVVSALQSAYSATLKDPIITVDLKDFQKPLFTVSGQVSKPGQYELRSEITVSEAIAIAGGLASTSTTHIYLFHRAPGGFNVSKIDLKPIFNGRDLKENALIQPGDMIIVPENAITKFRKYVPYSIGATYLPGNSY